MFYLVNQHYHLVSDLDLVDRFSWVSYIYVGYYFSKYFWKK